jgi:peroxiredoxin Q/BCP
MSKKKRKNSSMTTTKATAAKAARSGARTATGKPAAKASKAAAVRKAKKTVKKTAKKPSKTVKSSPAKTSHKAPSKSLRSAVPAPRGIPVEGGKAPAFRLPRDGGDSVALADFAGSKLVLFFYPRADTPGCTKEAIDFTRLKDAFKQANTAIVGISADTVKAQESFRTKHQLSVPLASDEKHEMLEAYGAWAEKSMYGRTFLGIVRTTVLIGADGRIARIWRNVRVDGHADEVLAAAQGL